MKIIHIVHGKANPASINGISRVVYYLNKYEKLAGVDSQIWALVDGATKPFTHVRDEFVSVECFPRVGFFGGRDIIKRLEDEKDSIGLVHFHLIWFYDKNIIMKALKRLGIPTVITTHGTYSKPHAYTGMRLLAKWVYELSYLNMANECHILTPEEGTGLRRYGYTGRSFVAYNGFEPAELPQDVSRDYFAGKGLDGKLVISMVAVLRKDKNIDLIIKAIALLPETIRQRFVFVLIGPDKNGNAAALQALAATLNVEQNFRWIGPLYSKEKYDALASSDGYIMASDSEGFSMAVIDAMATSLPMILTSGSNLKYVDDERFYIMCEPYPQHLADALQRFIGMSAEERLTLGQKANGVLHRRLHWEQIVTGMVQNYKRIISETKDYGR